MLIMAGFIGYLVSIDCKNHLGTLQGQISHIDPNTQALTLLRVYQNGVPSSSNKIIIKADEICNISIIEEAKETNAASEFSNVTVKKPVAKRAGRSVSESVANPKARDFARDSPRKTTEMVFSEPSKTPNKKDRQRQKMLDRDEACFGTPIDNIIEQDFDFEKNLALFNKKAVYQEINAAQRPDVVKQTDGRVPQYRHDENVIACAPTVWRQIAVSSPDISGMEYVTDDGLVIPSISMELRHQLFMTAERFGLGFERQYELMGRAATEMALQLLGGGHRLNPHNSHQWPTVVALCGSHMQGAIGVNAARQLASHGVKTAVFLLDPVSLTPQLAHEVALYRLTGHKLITSVQVTELPSTVDLIILACASESVALPAGYRAVASWANEKRAPVLALDPPRQGSPFVDTKFSLVPVLPLAHHQQNGKIYLCNLAFPLQVFKEVGIKYVSPFGPKFVIALHPNEP